MTTALDDLEAKAANAERFSHEDAERVLASVDLISVGVLGDTARRRISGDAVTFGRVCLISGGVFPDSRGEAGEVRLIGAPASIAEGAASVDRARAFAADLPLTAFSAAELFELCRGDLGALSACAERLRDAGLDAVAECAVDAFATSREISAVVAALIKGGLGVWRLTVDRAPLERRLELAERAAAVQDATGAIHAFAPLPRLDPTDLPSTGYDDVRSVAVARLVCREIAHIQVDWPLYGPKLAQVALAYGANDVDGVAAIDSLGLGPRRSPLEEIRRQVRDAASLPVERNGRYERLS